MLDYDLERKRVKMLPGQPGSRSLIRDLNVSLLIELVRRFGLVSRADLARESQLSAPTVSAIVRVLLNRGIFSEVAVAPSSGGRPPILLKLEPKAGYVVGVKLRGDGLTTVVCDLDGQVVKTAETSVALVGQPAAAIKEIAQATRKALSDASIPRSKVLAVGVGVSGIIDSQTGVCRFSHLLGWRDVEIAAPLRQKLRLPVWVDNDVNTLAVAEKWAGGGIEARNFVTLSIGRGIGIGIVIDRSLYRGTTGGVGELGHVVFDQNGPECECGKFGCLEAFVGERALLRRVGERLGHDVSREELVDRAASHDPATIEVLAIAGHELGLAVANVVVGCSPPSCSSSAARAPNSENPSLRRRSRQSEAKPSPISAATSKSNRRAGAMTPGLPARPHSPCASFSISPVQARNIAPSGAGWKHEHRPAPGSAQTRVCF